MKAKRNYRDSLFRSIFNNKKNLLSLYNALEGTDYTDAKEIRITTLRGTFFNDLKNDISFQIRNQYIVLLEHQSTVNENMPLRCLFYIGSKDELEESELHLSDAFAAESGALELSA